MSIDDDAPLVATQRTIRCGHCKQTHSTVAEVMECFGKITGDEATSGQRNFCQTLLRERQPTEKYADMNEDRINAFTKAEASLFIEAMKRQPFRRNSQERQPLPHPEVPEGFYAIQKKDGVDFYKVVDWRDTRLLFAVYGGPGRFTENRVNRHELAVAVMNAIAEDIAAASRLFGQKMEWCGVCSSPLTNDESKKYGIGPICRAKMGW